MACPHGCGAPATCSQCCGAVPRVVTRNESTGQLLVDGQPIERGFVLSSSARNGPAPRRGRPRKAFAMARARSSGDDL